MRCPRPEKIARMVWAEPDLEVKGHLLLCPECRRALDSIEETDAALKELGEVLCAASREWIDEGTSRTLAVCSRRRSFRSRTVLSLAAALVLGVVLSLFFCLRPARRKDRGMAGGYAPRCVSRTLPVVIEARRAAGPGSVLGGGKWILPRSAVETRIELPAAVGDRILRSIRCGGQREIPLVRRAGKVETVTL